jgi:hypothetical protein
MSKINFLTTFLCLVAFIAYTQPNGFNYQAIARENGNPMVNKSITVNFSISTSETGTPQIWCETHNVPTTGEFGVFTLTVGSQTNNCGNKNPLKDLDWKTGLFYLTVKIGDAPPSTQQLLTVPYAFYANYAKSAAVAETVINAPKPILIGGTGISIDPSTNAIINKGDNDNDPKNEIQTLTLDPNMNILTLSQTNIGVNLSKFNQSLEWNPTSRELSISGNPAKFVISGGGITNNPTPISTDNSLTGNGTSTPLSINTGGVTNGKIANAAVDASKLAQMGATQDQVLKWDGTKWQPAKDEVSTGGTGSTPDSWTTVGDNIYRAKGNVGIGQATAPQSKLHIKGDIKLENATDISALDIKMSSVNNVNIANYDVTGDGQHAFESGAAAIGYTPKEGAYLALQNKSKIETVRIIGSDPNQNASNGVVFLNNNLGKLRTVIGTTNNNEGGYIATYGKDGNTRTRITTKTLDNSGYMEISGLSPELNILDKDDNERASIYLDKDKNIGTVFAERFYLPQGKVRMELQDDPDPNKPSIGYVFADAMEIKRNAYFANTKVSIGNNSDGTGYVSANMVTLTSDLKLKKNIKSLDKVLPTLMQLSPVSYEFINQTTDNRSIGFIAQDIQKYYPQLVHKVPYEKRDDIYGIEYMGFSVLAIKAIQEQQQQIESLKSENTQLKQDLKNLESKLENVLKRLDMNETVSENPPKERKKQD